MANVLGSTQVKPVDSWKNLSQEDRVERLRAVIKEQREQLSRLFNTVEALSQLMAIHGHTPTGTAVVPIKEKGPTPTPYNDYDRILPEIPDDEVYI